MFVGGQYGARVALGLDALHAAKIGVRGHIADIDVALDAPPGGGVGIRDDTREIGHLADRHVGEHLGADNGDGTGSLDTRFREADRALDGLRGQNKIRVLGFLDGELFEGDDFFAGLGWCRSGLCVKQASGGHQT